jgi:anti-sigma B factor antagonist
MLKIEKSQKSGVTVISVFGDVDEEGVKDLRIALVDCLRDNQYDVVVNLSGMEVISYMGVGVLVERLRQFRSYDGDMKLVGLNQYTQRLFRMTAVTKLFETFESEAQAIQVYQKAA